MQSPENIPVTVFGGTGFLGSRVVRQLAQRNHRVRVAVRHPRTEAFTTFGGRVEQVRADLREASSVAEAIGDAAGVVNTVGLYVETRDLSFDAIHVDGAERVARLAHAAGARMVHVSGIGADPDSSSRYVQSRAQGENRVRAAASDAIILRPSVLFGPDDSFLTTLSSLVRALPLIPLFGRGATRLQPVHVDDVAEAIASLIAQEAAGAPIYELGGPVIYRYRELLALIAARLGRRRLLLPVPFVVWELLAALAALTPDPPITWDQIALMRQDNLANPDLPGFEALGIAPRALEELLESGRGDSA